jgi:DNA repair protein RecN (Recombination protein N)
VLEEIRIRGLGVISDAVLGFGPGLTVVTGETGAGKTMVVSGLALLFGGRADYSRLRPGIESASIEGRLAVPPTSGAARAVLEAGGDLEDDGGLVLRRVITAAGRSRAAAGGAAVPSSLLSRLADDLLAVHGQSDQLRLTQPAEQRTTLDRYAGIDLTEVRTLFEAWRHAVAELTRRRERARELAREAELLRHGLDEIAAVAPLPDEDTELAALAGRLEHADALRIAARTAHNALLGDADDPVADEPDVQTLLGLAARALSQLGGTDAELDALASRLTDLVTAAVDVGSELAGYERGLEADPGRLAEVHERRSALNGLLRKYGPTLADVHGWATDAAYRLAESDTSAEALAALAATRDRAAADYGDAAEQVSKQRRDAAAELSERITAELAGLAMPRAAVRVTVSPRPVGDGALRATVAGREAGATAEGVDEVAITLRPHPDAPELPVQRGASGGELSRVMLAIEVVLAGTDPVPTMVFDEVDAGVGGRAAVEVGRRLAQLAAAHQVIVVTHLAQVAAFADRHLVVDKSHGAVGPAGAPDGSEIDTGVTHSDIREVTGEARVVELARMLAGADTPVAREHAAELLATARTPTARTPTARTPAAGKRTARRPSGTSRPSVPTGPRDGESAP